MAGTQFSRSDPPKIGPESDSERQRQEKTTKIASGAVSGRTFSPPGPFLVTFGTHLAPKMDAFGPTFGRLSRLFGPLLVDMWIFFARGCSGRLLGSILGVPGGLPGWFWEGFCLNLLLEFCPKFGPNFVHTLDQWVFRRRFFPLLALPIS